MVLYLLNQIDEQNHYAFYDKKTFYNKTILVTLIAIIAIEWKYIIIIQFTIEITLLVIIPWQFGFILVRTAYLPLTT